MKHTTKPELRHHNFQPAKYFAGSTSLTHVRHRVMAAASYSRNRRYSDLVSEISFFPFYLFICRLFLFYQRSASPLSLSAAFPQLRPALAFFRRFEGRPHERIKPIHTLNLSTASHPATRYTWRIKRCYVNMEKVVDSCMRRA